MGQVTEIPGTHRIECEKLKGLPSARLANLVVWLDASRENEGRETFILWCVVSGKPRVECLLRVTYLEAYQPLLKYCALDFSPTTFRSKPGGGVRAQRQELCSGLRLRLSTPESEGCSSHP